MPDATPMPTICAPNSSVVADSACDPTPPSRQQAFGHLRDALALAVRGAHREALLAASEACHADPGLPEAHYAYGEAWLALGEPARAEEAFGAAIRLRPGWAEPWVNFGLARYRQGAVEEAKTAMRQALAAEPGHAAARANLGAFLRITGEAEAAEALLREAIEHHPHHHGARLNLVADLLQEERPGDALALLDAATPPTDDIRAARHWHLQSALAALQFGEATAARRALDALLALGPLPPEIRPLWHWRQVLLALFDRDPVAARTAAHRMEAALGTMGPEAVLEHKIMARYDLAKFWSGQGDHAAAFVHWTAGHALLKPSQPFSRDDHAAFIEASIETFTAARIADGARAENADPAPVFIVGMPRSGTTLCEQIIAAHPQAHGAGERPALGDLFHALAGGETPEGVARVSALSQAALDAAAVRYLADLHALAPDKARIVDKMPGNYRFVGLIGLLFPKARIIHCVRDPRDIGLSIFTFRFHGQHGYAHDLADLGWTIAQQARLMDHWTAVLPNNVLTVRLSDWVEDFDGTLKRVLAHVGLPSDPACARFYEKDSPVRTVSRSQVRQPINARGLGRWRTYEAELAPLIAELDHAGCLEGWRTGTEVHFAFAPDPRRTKAVDQAVRRRLIESMDTVLAAARDRGMAIPGDPSQWAREVMAARRVPPQLWAGYHDLVQAALCDNEAGVIRLASDLLGARDGDLAPPWSVITLTPHDLGAYAERYARVIDNDPQNPLALEAAAPAEVSRLAALVAEARDLLADADADLLDEIDTLGHQIVLATSAGPRGFGGAASLFLWGAVVLNPSRIPDRVTLIEALAHETAHALLFGLTLGDDLATNGPAERYASPLRPDPRPIEGIVHATYVLARMNHALARLRSSVRLRPEERALIDGKLARNTADYEAGLAIVEAHARLTGDGRLILDACKRAMAGGGHPRRAAPEITTTSADECGEA